MGNNIEAETYMHNQDTGTDNFGSQQHSASDRQPPGREEDALPEQAQPEHDENQWQEPPQQRWPRRGGKRELPMSSTLCWSSDQCKYLQHHRCRFRHPGKEQPTTRTRPTRWEQAQERAERNYNKWRNEKPKEEGEQQPAINNGGDTIASYDRMLIEKAEGTCKEELKQRSDQTLKEINELAIAKEIL